jgi:hypothetical protein
VTGGQETSPGPGAKRPPNKAGVARSGGGSGSVSPPKEAGPRMQSSALTADVHGMWAAAQRALAEDSLRPFTDRLYNPPSSLRGWVRNRWDAVCRERAAWRMQNAEMGVAYVHTVYDSVAPGIRKAQRGRGMARTAAVREMLAEDLGQVGKVNLLPVPELAWDDGKAEHVLLSFETTAGPNTGDPDLELEPGLSVLDADLLPPLPGPLSEDAVVKTLAVECGASCAV